MNKKGFTMVELLATLTILGIIMLIAVPNVMSILDKNEKRVYVDDAKKMQVLAEYKLRSDTTVERPKIGYAIAIRLQSLDMTELSEAPNGGTYLQDQSFVLIANESGTYHYYITLQERYDKGKKKKGINLTDIDTLNQENSINTIVVSNEKLKTYELAVRRNLGVGGTIQAIY